MTLAIAIVAAALAGVDAAIAALAVAWLRDLEQRVRELEKPTPVAKRK